MADDVDLRQEILQKTLAEVAHEDAATANPCVICLESISEAGIAVPCNHANFDFLCLASWLEQRRICPLCKSDVTAVKYRLDDPHGPKLYHLPPLASASTGIVAAHPHVARPQIRRPPRRPRPVEPAQPNDPLLRRRHIYRHQLYSLRVGSNRLSRYRELIPEMFNRDEELVSRARKWIRRELGVFSFLSPEAEEGASSDGRPRAGVQRLENRRSNNAEFLLEYIIAILRTVDMKGSAGQAEELLRDFLGRDNARLFLHELQAWLRSPYNSLEDWDRHVQYGTPDTPPPQVPAGDRTATPVHRQESRPLSGRVTKPSRPPDRRQHRSRSQEARVRERRLQFARERYQPD
ncbi:hypothetical protein ASPZODRAFT_150854 [Penicilliopsis zonata CBS 506.65]|uniref:RING-type E3 ubiquitin transferase n=1 Tax=Penicilliopsis zonata CBS 506.65 TaxID=1073090 RepID=A0A1L9SNP7_9EURO|nr:hypothetical protein ASPZODRAFT_150854 [Penicilliopsis zonata CBS 506.65]OJJ48667.1 hypothetical protein ASPZODRAFT_150854 [Penicilliopsis zonata CBS 506.65]